MKKETRKKEESRWINVHDDNVMREMGLIRPFEQTPRDKSVWTKTSNERRLLRSIRHSGNSNDMHFHTIPYQFVQIPGKLIIYLKKNKVYPKTTYSTECWKSDISDILAQYKTHNRKLNTFESIIAKYVWNGKTYSANELPI